MKILFLFFLTGYMTLQAAGLDFENETRDINADLNAKTVTSDFKFTNTGKQAVTIKAADAGCSCLAVEVAGKKMTYAPGESGMLRTTFEVGSFQGMVNKAIHIWLEGDPEEKPSHTIHLKVHVPVIISVEPKSLKWDLGKGGMQPIDVKMDYDKPITIKKVESSNPSFTSKLVTVEEGKHYRIEVTPVDITTPGLTIIRIETDADVEKHRIQQAFGVMRAPMKKP